MVRFALGFAAGFVAGAVGLALAAMAFAESDARAPGFENSPVYAAGYPFAGGGKG